MKTKKDKDNIVLSVAAVTIIMAFIMAMVAVDYFVHLLI